MLPSVSFAIMTNRFYLSLSVLFMQFGETSTLPSKKIITPPINHHFVLLTQFKLSFRTKIRQSSLGTPCFLVDVEDSLKEQ